MTWKELYDQMLDECSESCPTCQHYGAARILEELDPTAYRCGFVDYMDSFRDGHPCDCCCGTIPYDFIVEADMDDEVRCPVCAGTHAECEECGEIFPEDEVKGGLCPECVTKEVANIE